MDEKIFSYLLEGLTEFVTPAWVERMHGYFSENAIAELAEQIQIWIDDSTA